MKKNSMKEYWIVHLTDQVVMIYTLERGQYGKSQVFDREATLQVGGLPGMEIDLKEFFEDRAIVVGKFVVVSDTVVPGTTLI